MNEQRRGSASRVLSIALAAVAGALLVAAGGGARSGAEAPDPQAGTATAATAARVPDPQRAPSDPGGVFEALVDRSYVYTVDGHSTLVGPSHPMGAAPVGAPRSERPTYPPPAGQDAPAAPSNTPDIPLGVVGGANFDEPLARVNPTNPLNVVLSSHSGIRPSVNGGASYLPTVTFPGTLGGSNGDTAMAFDSLGRLFWANLLIAGDGDLQVMRVNPATGGTVTGPSTCRRRRATPSPDSTTRSSWRPTSTCRAPSPTIST